MAKTVQEILARFQNIKPQRQVWDGHWQDIKELVRCDSTDFNRKTVQGYRRYDLVYDGTAIDANEELASALHSNLTSPTERWFELAVDASNMTQDVRQQMMDDPSVMQWLELVADMIYDQYANPDVNFNPTLHEAYLDLGSFGTCVIYQEWCYDKATVLFKSHALATCYIAENSDGHVDTMWRYFEWNGRQIEQEFGDLSMAPKLKDEIAKDKTKNKAFKMLHHVCPRTDRLYGMLNSKNKLFASYWICESTQEMIEESGFDDFPYHASRWIKLGEETYGRGPAMKCLPDIKSLQAMEKVMLKAGQKAVDPPLVVPDDGFLLPIKTSPGSLIFKEPGAEKIEVLEFKGDVKFGLEQTNQKRDYIRKSFYSEWIKMEKDNKEMTATEVMDRRDEKLRLMAPMLGRQQTELLGPILQRTYNLLHSHNRIPPAPVLLQKRTLKIVYISPAARAQQSVKADRISRFLQDIIPLTQVSPDVMDAVDTDELVQLYANARGVTRTALRSPKDIAAMRQQRQQAQQAQQMAQVAEPASKSMLNLANAAKASGGGSPGGSNI